MKKTKLIGSQFDTRKKRKKTLASFAQPYGNNQRIAGLNK